jgi:riboflavin transporter FmnP
MGKQNRTTILTGTAIMAALVIVFDYALKYSGLKIPFPWYPNLKFDFTGVPIIMSLFMYGFSPAFTTSLVAGIGIVMRSGNWISASMKFFAELSTVFGLYLGESVFFKDRIGTNYQAWALGIASRVLIMTAVNLYVLPNFWRVPWNVTVGLLPLIAAFNIVQGLVTIGFGYFLFEAVKARLPNWSDG